jgi:hypothetical protein
MDEALRQILATLSRTELEDRIRRLRLNLPQGEEHVETCQILRSMTQFLSHDPSHSSDHIDTRKRTRDEFEESERNEPPRRLDLQSQQHSEQSLTREVQLSILQSLRFDTMESRHDAIKEEHKRTFEWIFCSSSEDAETRPWSNFADWLRSEGSIYWLNGKAGSGKSTLMKFIVDHPQTKAHLAEWSREAPVESPGFFFWNSGIPDQRSQEGLFRSLLWEILQRHQRLMPIVLRAEWEEQLEHARHNVLTDYAHARWTLSRLKKCFEVLIAQSSEQLRFCFFIDGLDEYDGEHYEIAEFFSEISTSPCVKFCISSRPWPVFKMAFSNLPQLRLQDLTHNDIQI